MPAIPANCSTRHLSDNDGAPARVPRTISVYDPVVCLAEKGELPARTPDPLAPLANGGYQQTR
jgi:hypothetical protein